MKTVKFLGVSCKQAKPTNSHRPAVWENMLGTVYAMNSNREVQYFDYDHDAAKKFAGITEASDPRVAKNIPPIYSWTKTGYNNPNINQLVLWVKE